LVLCLGYCSDPNPHFDSHRVRAEHTADEMEFHHHYGGWTGIPARQTVMHCTRYQGAVGGCKERDRAARMLRAMVTSAH